MIMKGARRIIGYSPSVLNIDGHTIQYQICGPYINAPGAVVIRFLNLGSTQGECLDVMTCRFTGETNTDMVARVFEVIRMA